jgi:hypothetical protein
MMKRAVLSMLLIFALVGAASPGVIVTSQILDYEKGWLFLTTGDGFRVAPNVAIVNGPAATRRYARVTFDGSGVVTKIEVSRTKLPQEGNLADVHRFAVALSPAKPNPELAAPPAMGRCGLTRPGKLVGLTITLQVPPSTGATDNVYMTSDQSGWNAQAYRLDRIDALHYRTTLKLLSGTQMHVLFDRGSTQSVQLGQNGIEQQPYLLCIGDEDAQAFRVIVYRWGDEQNGQTQQIPQALPTPYNPAPFPNLPTPPPH